MRLKLLAALSLAAVSSAPAFAVPVTYEFSGMTNGVSVPWAGNYYVNMGIPHATAFTGQLVLESDTAPYYEDTQQRSFYDQTVSFEVSYGAGGALGGFSGPEGLQVPPPWGWNSSSLAIGDDTADCCGGIHDHWDVYGSLAEPTGTAANVFYRFELWGVSNGSVWGTMPSLDSLPGTALFGQMGLNIWATLYDDAGGWLGETRLSHLVTDLHVVKSAVPEPATWTLMIAALLGLAALCPRRSRRLV
jgi:hypothetical protein